MSQIAISKTDIKEVFYKTYPAKLSNSIHGDDNLLAEIHWDTFNLLQKGIVKEFFGIKLYLEE